MPEVNVYAWRLISNLTSCDCMWMFTCSSHMRSHDVTWCHMQSHDVHEVTCSHMMSHGVTCSHMTHKDIKCIFTVHKLLVEKRVLDHVDPLSFLYLYGVEEAMSEHGAR